MFKCIECGCAEVDDEDDICDDCAASYEEGEEQMRDEIVKWLKMNASNHRIAASNARLVTKRREETIMGIAYQNAAEFLQNCVITKV